MLFSGKKTLPQPSEKRISERKQEGRKKRFSFASFLLTQKKRREKSERKSGMAKEGECFSP